jgi:phage baseplate assembly protein W
MQLAFPYGIDTKGRTASTDADSHVRDMIEELLFTTPGERVNRPNFGCGILQAVFAPASPEIAATLNFLTQSALQQWLSDVLVVEAVDVQAVDSTVTVTVRYRTKHDDARKVSQFTRTV